MKYVLVILCILLAACNSTTPTDRMGDTAAPLVGSAAPLYSTSIAPQDGPGTGIPPTSTNPFLSATVPSQTATQASTYTPPPKPTATQEPPTKTAALPANAINWEEASAHIGERITVCGPVVDATFARTTKGQPTFINLGRKYPDPNRFSILIWGKYRSKFSSPPESSYLDKNICVTGLIVAYKGQAEVEVNDPSQIAIISI